MAGNKKRNPTLSREEDIAAMKADVVSFFAKYGMKEAAANSVGRDLQTIYDWEKEDEQFRDNMRRAKSRFAATKHSKVRLDNLFANLYPDDFKPPKQELEHSGKVDSNVIFYLPDNGRDSH